MKAANLVAARVLRSRAALMASWDWVVAKNELEIAESLLPDRSPAEARRATAAPRGIADVKAIADAPAFHASSQ